PAPMSAFTYRPGLGRGWRAMSTSYCPKHTSYHEPGGANAMSAKGLRPALPGGPELEACGCGMASPTSEQSSGGGVLQLSALPGPRFSGGFTATASALAPGRCTLLAPAAAFPGAG